MSEQIRVGVVGTSWWADRMHLPSIKSHPQAHLAAICGRNRDRADEMAAKYGIPLVFTDYHEMLAKAGLDAVVISVPDDLHYPITMAALDAGLHVMCEKPLASNAEQARAMYQKAEAVGVKHGVFFTYPWLSHYRQLQRLLDAGYIGRPYHCSLRFLAGYTRSGQYLWRVDAERANGILGDLGAHMIQFARLYMGEIARVSAHLGAFVERTPEAGRPFQPANDAAVLAVEFANGAHGTLQVSAVAYLLDRVSGQHVELHGSAGTLESTGEELRGAREGEAAFSDLAERGGKPDGTTNPYDVFRTESVGDRLFIDAILEDKPFSPSFYDGWKVQEVIDAALASHQEGRWMAVEVSETHDPVAVVKALDAACNAGDIEGVMARFTDDAILKDPVELKVHRGKQQIREWFVPQMGHFQVTARGHRVTGNTVTWRGTLTGDIVGQMGSEVLEEAAEAVVQGGKITSFALTIVGSGGAI